MEENEAVINNLESSKCFLNNLKGDYKKLLNDCEIKLDYTYNGVRKVLFIYLKKNFISDGASIPKFLNFIIKEWYEEDEKNFPARIHDAICVFGGVDLDKTMMEFDEASALFEALLLYCDVCGKFKAALCYKGVSSVFGEYCYYNTNENDEHNQNLVSWTWEKKEI